MKQTIKKGEETTRHRKKPKTKSDKKAYLKTAKRLSFHSKTLRKVSVTIWDALLARTAQKKYKIKHSRTASTRGIPNRGKRKIRHEAIEEKNLLLEV